MFCPTSLLLIAAAVNPAPSSETLELAIGGVPYGTEEFLRTVGTEDIELRGKASLKIPGLGDMVLSQESRLARDGHPVSYSLDIEAPGQQVTVRAVPSATGYALSITSKGATEPLQSRDVAVKVPVYLLDNNLASHLDNLTRELRDLAAGEQRTVTVLVPQVLQAFSARVKRGADGTASQGGAPVATRSYRLEFANVGTDLVARAEDGALLQADVPMQKATFKRRGFESASASPVAVPTGPVADPREKATEVKGPAGALPAMLLVPKSGAPVPAVVFLSGSGPNDKDETIGPNKPFADIARGLGDRGIASLRFDKRTLAIKDKSKFANAQLRDEYYEDAAVAIALVRATPGIDPERIFVVGHSEGAMVAPKVAAAAPGVDGIVMMAPAVRPIDAVIIDQMEYGAKLTGRSADEIAEQTKDLKATFAAIRDPERKNTPPFLGAPAGYWRELIAVDVPKLVKESKLPILVLQGDQDFQVRKDADFELLRTRAGSSGGRVTYRSFAGLNHLFMKVEHESTGTEYAFPAHVEPVVISVIADWILLR